MFIGSSETAKRVLRGGFKGPVVLIASKRQEKGIVAGGPGSGCHGPNCGRPEGSHAIAPVKQRKTAAGILKKMGWVRLNQGALGTLRLPHWKKGIKDPKLHTATVYRHNRYGYITVSHSGGFQHTDFDGKVVAPGSGAFGYQRLGKEAVNLERYLNQLQAVVPVEKKPEPKPEEHKPTDSQSAEIILTSAPITSKKELGGGVNKTKIVTLEDGSKAVFKQSDQAGDDTKEVAAWQVAKLVGMQDMVSPAVMRTIDGEEGALIQWKNGQVAREVGKPFDHYDGERAAAWDYVIGHQDRHRGNWVVENPGKENEKIHLIDHGISFGMYPDFHAGFVQNQVAREDGRAPGFDAEDKPASPKTFAAPYRAALPQIKKIFDKFGFSDRYYDALADRVNSLSESDKWDDLKRW